MNAKKLKMRLKLSLTEIFGPISIFFFFFFLFIELCFLFDFIIFLTLYLLNQKLL